MGHSKVVLSGHDALGVIREWVTRLSALTTLRFSSKGAELLLEGPSATAKVVLDRRSYPHDLLEVPWEAWTTPATEVVLDGDAGEVACRSYAEASRFSLLPAEGSSGWFACAAVAAAPKSTWNPSPGWFGTLTASLPTGRVEASSTSEGLLLSLAGMSQGERGPSALFPADGLPQRSLRVRAGDIPPEGSVDAVTVADGADGAVLGFTRSAWFALAVHAD